MPGSVPQRLAAPGLYLLLFGLFLGLSIVKFGNPVILDQKIIAPTTLREAWTYAWPTHWAYWLLVPLALAGAGVALAGRPRWPGTRWLWVLPLLWFVWQLVSATQSVDGRLTAAVLWHFGGCLACYFAGALLSGDQRVLRWLLVGVLAAFTFSLVRAVNQRLFEFPQERRLLLEGEQCGWTNFPPAMVLEMKQNSIIITTNGVDIANPDVLVRYAKRRVMGTLVYANALAGAVLLLWPVSFAIACNSTRRFRPATRVIVIALTVFLGGAGLFWTGSKLGWLIALALVGLWLLRLDWPKRWKYALLAFALLAGLGVFAIRFHHYFATGATSVGARFDYWRAAMQITRAHPLFGSGPGTFQRPYDQFESAGSGNGQAGAQRLSRTVLRLGNSSAVSVTPSGLCWRWRWPGVGACATPAIRSYWRLPWGVGLVSPGPQRIRPVYSRPGLDGVHAAGLAAGWPREIKSTSRRPPVSVCSTNENPFPERAQSESAGPAGAGSLWANDPGGH